MFASLVDDTKDPEGFLDWWNENPIILGGDRYGDSPGLAIYYIQHSDAQTFELRIEPVQPDQLDFTKSFLGRILGDDPQNCRLKVKLSYNDCELAQAVIYVDQQYRWAAGEGIWNTIKGHPRNWELSVEGD